MNANNIILVVMSLTIISCSSGYNSSRKSYRIALKDIQSIKMVQDSTAYGNSTDILRYNTNNQLHGKCYYFFDGVLIATQVYKNGLEHGWYYSFFKNGKVKSAILYKKGKTKRVKQTGTPVFH